MVTVMCLASVLMCQYSKSQKIFPRQTNIILDSSHKLLALFMKIGNGNPYHLQQNMFLFAFPAFPKADPNNGLIISGRIKFIAGKGHANQDAGIMDTDRENLDCQNHCEGFP